MGLMRPDGYMLSPVFFRCWKGLLAAGLLAVLLAVPAAAQSAPRGPETVGGEPVSVETEPVALNPSDSSQMAVGRLRYRGGLTLTGEWTGFGGWSGLEVSGDGARVILVSDKGRWLTARLDQDSAGRLSGLTGAESGILPGLDGAPLRTGGSYGDAEDLALGADGRLIVTFERVHRLWTYPNGAPPFQGPARGIPLPGLMAGAPSNEGIEAVTALPDGRLLIVTEGYSDAPDTVLGWIGGAEGWASLRVAVTGGYRPTSAGALATGEVFLLERRFNPLDGLAIRVRRFAPREIRPGALLEGEVLAKLAPPITVDNFEGIAVRRAAGETLIYILSDDNLRDSQRSLLLLFALPD